MRKIVLWTVAAGALSPLLAGCCQKSQVLRGQSPRDMRQMSGPQGQQVVQAGSQGTMDPYCDPSQAGDPTQSGAYCPPGMPGNGGGYCEGGYGGAAYIPGKHCHPPTSYNMYPPPGDVPAVVQYPYYTTKGPDDFFLK